MTKIEEVLISNEAVRTRLKDILDNHFPNRESAATVAGKDKDMLGRYISGKSSPSFETMSALANHAGVSLNWLAFGYGNKYIMQKDAQITTIKVYTNPNTSIDFEDDNCTYSLSLSKKIVENYNISQNCIGILVSGDSMSPKLKNGDIAIIDTSITDLKDDNIYAFMFENHCYIKQLQKLGKEIGIKSLNHSYENWKMIPNETFKIIGQLQLSLNQA